MAENRGYMGYGTQVWLILHRKIHGVRYRNSDKWYMVSAQHKAYGKCYGIWYMVSGIIVVWYVMVQTGIYMVMPLEDPRPSLEFPLTGISIKGRVSG